MWYAHMDKMYMYLCNKYQEISIERYQGILVDRYQGISENFFVTSDIYKKIFFLLRSLSKERFSLI